MFQPRPFTWRRLGCPLLLLGAVAYAVPVLSGGQTTKPSPAAVQFFETKVRPILAENCFRCHGEKKQRGELRLDSLAAALEGGGRGPALVPGHPEKSLLIKAIGHEDKDLKMPEDKKLPREHIETLTQWIKMALPGRRGQNRRIEEGRVRYLRPRPRPLVAAAGQAARHPHGQEQPLGQEPDRRVHPRGSRRRA